MRPLRCLALLAGFATLTVLAGAPRAFADRLFVPGKVRTIQAAIDRASDGDTVWVAAGTYRGPFTLKKSLVLFGDAGPDQCILDGRDSVRVLSIEGVHGAAVVGFTIRRGRANSGGGISCVRDTSIMVASCVFEKNWESGIAAFETADLNLRDTRFVENQGSGMTVTSSDVLLAQCTFSKNHGYAGGAISFVNSQIPFPIRACTFEENSADEATGGAVNADSSNVNIGDSQFTRNIAKVAGGAVAAMDHSRVGIGHCVFLENQSASSAALHSDSSTLNIGLSTFVRNAARGVASAIGVVGRGLANVNPIYRNNTFYKNSAEGEAAVIWLEHCSPEIRMNIFDLAPGQKVVAGLDQSPLYECNLVHDPSASAVQSTPPGFLFGDPLFCDAPNGDFSIRDLSPAARATCGPIGASAQKCASFSVIPSK
jgi:hypothetical protein